MIWRSQVVQWQVGQDLVKLEKDGSFAFILRDKKKEEEDNERRILDILSV